MRLEAALALTRGKFTLDAAIDVAAGEVVALLGPNGAGKTTAVRALAGLTPLGGGRVLLGAQVLEDPVIGVRLPAEQRGIGVVFQEGLLFPHRSVRDNVAFGLRARGWSRDTARRRAEEWLERLEIAHLRDAKPRRLSGGEAQRVALGRTLAAEPQALLLDEPMSALDVEVRHDVRTLLRRELKSFPGPCLLVTHDPVEALTLADRFIVLEDGKVTQEGSAHDVTSRPRTPWIARFAGANLYRGTAHGHRLVAEEGAEIVLASPAEGAMLVLLRPQAVTLHRRPPEGSPRNVWQGRIKAVEPVGDRFRISVEGTLPVIAEITAAAAAELDLAAGGAVWAAAKATELEAYPVDNFLT